MPALTASEALEISRRNAGAFVAALNRSDRGKSVLPHLAALAPIIPTLDKSNRLTFAALLEAIQNNETPATLADLLKPYAHPSPDLHAAARLVVDSWSRPFADLAAAVRELAATLAQIDDPTDHNPDATTPADACRALVDAYRNGLASAGSVNWADIDNAHELAREALNLPLTDPDDDEPDAQPITTANDGTRQSDFAQP
jgi:hypothetical protein